MKKIVAFIFAGLLTAQLCFAAGNSRITLNDGTTIYGKVVGMSDGVYKIQTETMGEISVNSDNVVEISSGNSSKKANINIIDGSANNKQSYPSYSGSNNQNSYSSGAGKSYSTQQQNANTMVQSMMMDENFMNNMLQLSTSSEMQSVLNDPEVMEAIQNGDYDFLMNNSKMNDLMNSSGIQDLLGEMEH